MRVVAQDILKKENYRRRVFDEKAVLGKNDKAVKQAFLEDAALQFAADILDEFNIPSVPDIAIGTLRGFEKDATNFNNASGYIEVYAKFKTMSTVFIRIDLLMPIIRGELYRPSIVRINGKKIVFSPFVIDAVLAETETIRPVSSGMYRDRPDLVHVDNVEHGMYEIPMSDFAQPVHDRYLYDEHHM